MRGCPFDKRLRHGSYREVEVSLQLRSCEEQGARVLAHCPACDLDKVMLGNAAARHANRRERTA